MYVYHLTPYTSKASGDLNLCVPTHRIDGEEATLPRICVSKSLDGCLTSIGPHNICIPFLQDMLEDDGLQRGVGHTELKFPYILHTFKIRLSDIILGRFWNTQKISKYVPDAKLSQECWIIKPIQPESVRIVWLKDAWMHMEDLELDGELCDYVVFENSKWSDNAVLPERRLKARLFRLTERVLMQTDDAKTAQKLGEAELEYESWLRPGKGE